MALIQCHGQAEVQDRQAGLDGDRELDLVGELESVRSVHFLFREKEDDQVLEPLFIGHS